jgi:hypothetical protein
MPAGECKRGGNLLLLCPAVAGAMRVCAVLRMKNPYPRAGFYAILFYIAEVRAGLFMLGVRAAGKEEP